MLQHLENALWRIIQKLIHKRVQSHPQDNFEHIIILPLLQSINSNTSIDALTCLIPGKLDLHKCSTMGISTKVGETWWKPKISIYNSTLLHQLFNMCFYCFGSHNNPKALTAFVDSHASEAAQDNEKKRKRKRRRVINWALLKGIGKAIPRHHEFWKVPKAPVSFEWRCTQPWRRWCTGQAHMPVASLSTSLSEKKHPETHCSLVKTKFYPG